MHKTICIRKNLDQILIDGCIQSLLLQTKTTFYSHKMINIAGVGMRKAMENTGKLSKVSKFERKETKQTTIFAGRSTRKSSTRRKKASSTSRWARLCSRT